jgi:release factor glutamine methyltransferase
VADAVLPFDAAERLPAIAEALREADVAAVLLRAPTAVALDGRCLPSVTRHQIDLLVPPHRAVAARRALERFDWRFELGGRGMWRAIPHVSYLWDDLLGIEVLWGISGAPLAVRRAVALERRIWRRAQAADHGLLLAQPDDLIVYGALQASRPGRPQKFDAEDLAHFVRETPLERALEAAHAVGLDAAVARGLRNAGVEAPAPRPAASWTIAGLAWRWLHPRRFRGLLFTGAPRLGRAITRARFAGHDFLSGYGVFLPRALSEGLVAGALPAVAGERSPLVVDVGTGCGAVALAIARAHDAARVHAVDTSARALWWARFNRPVAMLRRVRFHHGSLLSSLPRSLHGRVTVMTANVPYVPPDLWGPGWTSRAGTVVGRGDDGLDLYRALVRQASAFLAPGGLLVFQVGRDQWPGFRGELEAIGYRTTEPLTVSRGDVVTSARWTGDADRVAS